MINESKFISALLAEFNNGTKGKTYIIPPSQYISALKDAARHYEEAEEVHLDTCVITFWAHGHCLYSINLLQWQDAALSELFDLVLPKLYDNRCTNEDNNGIAKLWRT